MTTKCWILTLIFIAALFCGGLADAAEALGNLQSSTTCAVAGKVVEIMSVAEGFEIEMDGIASPVKMKTRLVNGSFEFQAVPPGPYQFRVFDHSGKVILRRTAQLTGTGDFIRFRRDLPFGSEDLVSVHQLKHKTNDRAMKLFHAGLKALEAGDLQKSVDSLEKATELDPLFSQAHLNLIRPYLQLKQNDKALDHARKAYQIDPDLFETGYDLAATLTLLGRYQEAEAVARSLPTTYLFKSEYETVLALSLFGQRRITEGNEHLNLAVADFPTARLIAADTLTLVGQIGPAMDQVREYLQMGTSACERRDLEAWLERAAARQARTMARSSE